jgi:hypothetical protein
MFNFFSSTTPDDVAIAAAFFGGIGAVVIGYVGITQIKDAFKVIFTPAPVMAKRNKA